MKASDLTGSYTGTCEEDGLPPSSEKTARPGPFIRLLIYGLQCHAAAGRNWYLACSAIRAWNCCIVKLHPSW